MTQSLYDTNQGRTYMTQSVFNTNQYRLLMTQKIKQNLKYLYDTVSLRHRFYRVAQIKGVSI